LDINGPDFNSCSRMGDLSGAYHRRGRAGLKAVGVKRPPRGSLGSWSSSAKTRRYDGF
jgi:hypothetical protein